MHDPLTPEQASQIVTALCTLIVAGTLCYLVKLLMQLKEEFRDMRERMSVHFTEDENLASRISRMEEHMDRMVKIRSLRRRDDD